MWRLCDLHNHSTPNDQDESSFEADVFVRGCLQAHLDVVAITNHDHLDGVEEIVAAAAATSLIVVPGLEISTDRGHVLALAPGPDGSQVLTDLCVRLEAEPHHEVNFFDAVDAVQTGFGSSGRFADRVLLIGGHVDQEGSLLAANQAGSVASQLKAAEKLAALEVINDVTRAEWLTSGVKQSGKKLTLVRGSDTHSPAQRIPRATWIYLPEVDFASLRHALATPEASIRFDGQPAMPTKLLKSLEFEGGTFDGLQLNFCERTNALIGPPSSGKSLIIDALRYAFGSEASIAEIRQICESRLSHCLPEACTVRIRGISDGIPFEIERHRGATQTPTPPFQPIVFSQTELVRRAMEDRPSMSLLDIHCHDVNTVEKEIVDAREDACTRLISLVEWATRARQLSSEISNPVDGLAETRKAIEELAGSEPTAKLANDMSRVHSWRKTTRNEFSDWLEQFESPELPSVPSRPSLETEEVDQDRYMPSKIVDEAIQQFSGDIAAAAKRLVTSVLQLLDESEPAFQEAEDAAKRKLTDEGFEAGEEVIKRLGGLRERLTSLEGHTVELHDLEEQIDVLLAELRKTIRHSHELHTQLRTARKDTCTRLNDSMRAFFVRILEDADLSELDALLEDAKVGSQIWSSSVPEIRINLDRERLVETAVRFTQDRLDKLPEQPSLEQQDSIVRAALERGKVSLLGLIATTWPTDGLDLSKKASPPVPFDKITEGMRALAIKEISFAASDLPVITDQPEDAVPSQAVFDTLVPTIRRQRSDRQFILASHDANIVVAGDVERVWVLGGDGSARIGNLFEEEIRKAALELLEGGREAFEFRRLRYGTTA